jgi:hypothetical protein
MLLNQFKAASDDKAASFRNAEEGFTLFWKGLLGWGLLMLLYAILKRWGWLSNPTNEQSKNDKKDGPRNSVYSHCSP